MQQLYSDLMMQKQKTGTLRIVREQDYFAILRALVILIDGKKVGQVGNDSFFKIDLMPGDYIIQVRMDWCKSKPFEFDIMEGQTLTLGAVLNGGVLGALFNSNFNWSNLYTLVPMSEKSQYRE
jgi:hypothetical protein